ncbi:MAG: pyrroline-5-carboxylate reductase [Methylobacillus sp.]|jgi:pyrroline-5-carboxylate reductase|nr:pyrroline-5-carboxylate reductase [Methylobacillus sp.]
MKISFIGGGNMARALIGGLIAQGRKPGDIGVVEPDADKRKQLQTEYGIAVSDQMPGAASADIVVLAVKPQQLRDIAIFLGSLLRKQLVISIAAGIRSRDLMRWLGGYDAVIRVMPNTPAQIRSGASALFAASGVNAEQRAQAETIFSAVGGTVWLDDEAQMDAVTAVSGSGPAYVFYFIEAMQQAARELGLTDAQARELSLQTFLGASQLARQSAETPDVLRAQVTSKGGTTERALLDMENSGVKAAIVRALHAAAERSRELGDLLGKD